MGNGKKISFIFHATISPVNATISTLQVQLYIITGIMIILSILLAMVIAKRISKPIEVISGSAKGLASGSYNTHFTGKGFLEICELSDTLNVAAAELSKVENLRRELMANISHDLRTPLALIYSYAEMMQDFPTEITREQTQVILDETKRLSTLVSDVLDISKLESGMVELNMAKYNLTESLQKTINPLAEMIKKDGFTISFEPLETVNIFADETKIMQVFYNLLINAVNYSGKHKIITVRQNCVNNFVKIEVTDHGEGITPENLPYIWDRYYKANKTHKRATIGTGLGLSIVKKIIDLHAGNYGVDSEVGVGSTFWFSLKV